jgi:geranylgeranyl diphosphate synthase type I
MSVITMLKDFEKSIDDFLLGMLRLGASDEFYEIVRHQVVAGGKRIRPALTILACEAVGGDSKSALPAAVAIELVHNYTLIFDDIIDRSDLRRGLPTVRAKYSDVMAILAGMHYREAIFEAARRSSKSSRIGNVLSAALKRIIEGERIDVLFEQAGRESEYVKKKIHTSVSEKDYFEMVGAKTASLFEAAFKVGGIVGNGTPSQVNALSKFGENCGIAFQIRDDILDMVGDTAEFGKEAGKDIREHKLGNLALLYGFEELLDKDREKLTAILRSPNVSDSDVKEGMEIILSTNGVKRAYDKSRSFIETAKSSIDKIPSSEAKCMLLSLADFIAKRKF